MTSLHTVPDAAEDQQLLLDVRALLERHQRAAAKNRALEAHRERVEATLGRDAREPERACAGELRLKCAGFVKGGASEGVYKLFIWGCDKTPDKGGMQRALTAPSLAAFEREVILKQIHGTVPPKPRAQ